MTPTPFAAHRARPITPNVESAPPDPAAAQEAEAPRRQGDTGLRDAIGGRAQGCRVRCFNAPGSSGVPTARVSCHWQQVPWIDDRALTCDLPPTVTSSGIRNSLTVTRVKMMAILAQVARVVPTPATWNRRPFFVPRAAHPEKSHMATPERALCGCTRAPASGECRRRLPEYPAHGSLYRVGAGAVQEFLAVLIPALGFVAHECHELGPSV